jgi:hypothetical protein
VIAATSAGPARAEGQAVDPFRPAGLDTGDRSVAAVAQCPDIGAVTVTVSVFCRVAIDENGDADHRRSRCAANQPSARPFAAEADKAIRIARFLPAAVDGAAVPVNMPMTLAFQYDGGACRTIAVPNMGASRERFGLSYSAPQEITDRRSWFDASSLYGNRYLKVRQVSSGLRGTRKRYALPQDNSSVRDALSGEEGGLETPISQLLADGTNDRHLYAVMVDEHGEASDAEALDPRNGTIWNAQGLEKAMRALAGARFIPGMVAGEPTRMRHLTLLP